MKNLNRKLCNSIFAVLCLCLLTACPKPIEVKPQPEIEHESDRIGIDETPVSKYGQLSIQGKYIMSKNGKTVMLRGMSLFWSQWNVGGPFYNADCVKWLKDDWRCTVVRAAMGVDSAAGGYLRNPNIAAIEKQKVKDVVEAAIKEGVYVIIDWHAHHAHARREYIEAAKEFFAEMAKEYGHHPNVIYETFNEPLDVEWNTVLKPYHEEVIAAIREHDPDNIIICGTRNWAQRVDEAAFNPIAGNNIAYALHFYAGSHQGSLRSIANNALRRNICIFVSEFGTVNADGDGPVNHAETRIWLDYLEEHRISWANWSITSKDEGSAAIGNNPSPTGGWTEDQITESGKLVRDELLAKNPPMQ